MAKRPGIKLKVASPCDADWGAMKGDDAVRHCGLCKKDVYQISNMSNEQVEEFLLSRKGIRTCVRFYQRADGTLLTSDCSVGRKQKRKKRVLKVVGAAALSAGVLGANTAMQTTQGEVSPTQAAPLVVPAEPEPVQEMMGAIAPDEPEPVEKMGEVEMMGEAEEEFVELMGDIAYEPENPEEAPH